MGRVTTYYSAALEDYAYYLARDAVKKIEFTGVIDGMDRTFSDLDVQIVRGNLDYIADSLR